MTTPRKKPSILPPIVSTILALLGLAICLMALSVNSPTAQYMIWGAILFIASSVLHWVNYVRLYIDFRVETAMQTLGSPSYGEQAARS